MPTMNKKTALITLLAIILIGVIGVSAYFLKGIERQERKIPIQVQPAVPSQLPVDTSDWKVYRNEGYGFEVSYPGDWQVFAVYSSRGVGQQYYIPGINPETITFHEPGKNPALDAPSIKIIVGAPGFVSSEPATNCIQGQPYEVSIAGLQGKALEGQSTAYCPKPGVEAKEIILVREIPGAGINIYDFYASKESEEVFNQMINSLKFFEPNPWGL